MCVSEFWHLIHYVHMDEYVCKINIMIVRNAYQNGTTASQCSFSATMRSYYSSKANTNTHFINTETP